MLTYLFDACAAVEMYLPERPDNKSAKRVLSHILEQKTTFKQATIFIPNICIAEVFNTFARKHFEPKDSDDRLSDNAYEICLTKFRNDIHWGRTLYPYDLNRYHIIATDKIVIAEHLLSHLYEDKRDRLSTFDVLIIAMACELAYVGQREDTFLVTRDRRLSRVCEELKKTGLPKPLEGPLGELDAARWRPPTCLYLNDLKRGDLKNALGQRPYQH